MNSETSDWGKANMMINVNPRFLGVYLLMFHIDEEQPAGTDDEFEEPEDEVEQDW